MPSFLGSKGTFAPLPAQIASPGHPYPPSALRPVRTEGTLPFLLVVAGIGLVLVMGRLILRRRASSKPGLPDEPLFPPAMPHQKIHDRKYLSRILSSDDPPRS